MASPINPMWHDEPTRTGYSVQRRPHRNTERKVTPQYGSSRTAPRKWDPAAAESYERTFTEKKRAVATPDVIEKPYWLDNMREQMYLRYSPTPSQHGERMQLAQKFGGGDLSIGEATALQILGSDEGMKARGRRYGDVLDPYYKDASGEVDYRKVYRDNFVVEVEEAYYAAGGDVPIQFFVDHVEDLKMLGPDYAEMVKLIYADQELLTNQLQAEELQTGQFEDVIDGIATSQGIARSSASRLLLGMPEILTTVGEEMEGKTFEELYSMVGSIQSTMLTGQGLADAQRSANLVTEQDARDAYTVLRGQQLADEKSFQYGDDFAGLLDEVGVTKEDAGLMETVGVGFNNIVTGIGWLGDAHPVSKKYFDIMVRAPMEAELPFSLPSWAPGSGGTPGRNRANEVTKLKEEMGRDLTREDALMMGGAYIDDLWEQMVSLNDPAYEQLMTMYGGDEAFAKRQYLDAWANDDDIQAAMKEDRNVAMDVEITRLEESDYSVAGGLLDVLGTWGDATEYVAVFGSTVLKYWLQADDNREASQMFTTQFLQDIGDSDTPADVWGLEGTAIGLGINILGMALADPTTYIFAPGLSKAAGLGVKTSKQATTQAYSRWSRKLLVEGADMVRSSQMDNMSLLAALEDFALNNMDEAFVLAAGGFQKGVRAGARMFGELAKVTDDVSAKILDLLSATNADTAAVKVAREAAEAGNITSPVVVSINPVTKAAGVTKGEATLQALRGMDIDAIPVTFKLDKEFGIIKHQLGPEDFDEGVTARLIKNGEKMADAPVVGEYAIKDGTITVRKAGDTYAAFEDGKFVGMVERIQSKDPQIATIPAARDRGVGSILRDIEGPEGAANIANSAQKSKSATILTEGSDSLITPMDDLFYPEWAQNISADAAYSMGDDIFLAPRDLLGEARFGGSANIPEMQRLYQKALMNGISGFGGQRTTLAMRAGASVRGAMAHFKPTDDLAKFLTPINVNPTFAWSGTMAKSNVMQFGTRLWSSVDDMGRWAGHNNRIREFYGRLATMEKRSTILQNQAKGLKTQYDQIMEMMGGGMDDWAGKFGAEVSPQAKANRSQLMDELESYNRQIAAVRKEQAIVDPARANYTELNTIMQDMVNDFNVNHIAKHKSYIGDVDPKTGMVPWDKVRQGSIDHWRDLDGIAATADKTGKSMRVVAADAEGFIPKELDKMLGILDDKGISANEFLALTTHMLNSPGSWNAPVTPLEMMAAATGGRRAVAGVLEATVGNNTAQFFHKAHSAWMLDKVLTPRTGIVVSLDEWMRIFYEGGSKSYLKYAEDKAMFLTKRVLQAKNTPGDAWAKLPSRWQSRITALQEYPTHFRQLERSFLETNGYGFDVIKYKKGTQALAGNKEYYKAARRNAGELSNDKVFQAYLRGKEYFTKEWWDTSTEAATMRGMDFPDAAMKGRRIGLSADEAFESYETIFNDWVLSGIKSGDKAEARRLWTEAVGKAAGKGSSAAGPVELPDWVLQGFKQVTGNKQTAQGPVGKTLQGASSVLFDNPMEYRRGFLAEMVRETEGARLDKLFASQGRKIVPEADIISMMRAKYPNLTPDLLTTQADEMAQELLQKQGMVSQRYVENLIERQVVTEMENVLYAFQMGSRAGRSSKFMFPFGKPWADMWGYWGKQLVSKPQLRGWVNDTNFAGLNKVANAAVDHMPINPKTGAFISRLKTTDFNLDRIEEDPLVGGLARAVNMDRLDLTPAIFLPTETSQPMATMIPGFGMVPSGIAQAIFAAKRPDPLEDPIGYMKAVDEVSQYFPNIGYAKPGDPMSQLVALAFGGGATSRIKKIAQALAVQTPFATPSMDSLGEDWSARLTANNQIRVMWQVNDFMAELQELPPEMMDIGITALLDENLALAAQEAASVAGSQQFKEAIVEGLTPVRTTFATQGDALTSVWIEASDWMGLDMPWYYDVNGSEEEQRDAAQWARRQFFDLPDWERDTLVTEHNGLAVNLVSGWVWTDRAQDLGLPNVGLPYRTDGSTEGLARHQAYQQQALVRPITPRELMIRVVGTILTARSNTSRSLYEQASGSVNDTIWEGIVPEDMKGFLDGLAEELSTDGHLPYRSGRELWENYGQLQISADFIDPPNEEEGKKPFSLPSEWLPWGESYPSDGDAMRKTLRDLQLEVVTPEMKRMAQSLGMSVSTDMSFIDFYNDTATMVQEEVMENGLFAYAGAEHTKYVREKSAGLTATKAWFSDILNGDHADQTQVYEARRTLVFIEEVQHRKSIGDSSWLDLREEAVTKWGRMAQDDLFENQDPAARWDEAWGKSLGAFDWVPDEPPALDDPNAQRVFVRDAVDGDTLTVTNGGGLMGANEFYSVRLLGLNAAELGTDEGEEAHRWLNFQLRMAVENGVPVTVIMDPNRYGEVDMFGRRLGWVYIGDEPLYKPETMLPGRSS